VHVCQSQRTAWGGWLGTCKPLLDSQTLAALGATCVDHSTATAGFHTDEETVGTCAANFGRLVSAFHNNLGQGTPSQSGEPAIMTSFLINGNTLAQIVLVIDEVAGINLHLWISS